MAGVLEATGSAEEFRANPAFAAFMQHIIRLFGPDDPRLRESAREQGEGAICIIDLRTPEGIMGTV